MLSNIQTFLLYFAATLILTCFVNYTNKTKHPLILILLSSIPLLLISTFRVDVGTDYLNYEAAYFNSQNITIMESLSAGNLEIGYLIINKIGYLFKSFNFVLLLSSLLTLVIPIYAIDKYSKYDIRLFTFFYSLLYFFSAFNGIRQGIAMSIFFLAIFRYLKDDKKTPYIIAILIASTFHMTALFTLPIIFISFDMIRQKNGMKYVFLMILPLTVIYIFFDHVLLFLENIPFLSTYSKYKSTLEANNFSFYVYLTIFFIVYVFKKPMFERNKNINIILLFVMLSLILQLFGFRHITLGRMSGYFHLFLFIMMFEFVNIFSGLDRMFFKSMLYVYAATTFIVFYWIIGHSNLFPYMYK